MGLRIYIAAMLAVVLLATLGEGYVAFAGRGPYHGEAGSISEVPTIGDLKGVVLQFIGIITIALPGIATVYLILLSGFYYITARGDPESFAKAKGTATYAVAGLLIILFASLIIKILGITIGYEIPLIQP